jgi:hypothetical protein
MIKLNYMKALYDLILFIFLFGFIWYDYNMITIWLQYDYNMIRLLAL